MALTSIIIGNKSQPKIKSWFSGLAEFKEVLSELTKFRITFFVSVTTFVGYILHNGLIDIYFLLPTLGVLVLASGASALNEYQERNVDSKMARTSSRPIPMGRISANNAWLVAFALILFGSGILALHSTEVLILGLFTLGWYNGVYTPLKQKSAVAIIPGSLVGAMPPIIGWAASGGSIVDPQIIAFASFMFVWQIPHFWLLLLMYDDQYKNAGFPTLSKLFSLDQITKITYTWILILISSSVLFYFSNLSTSIIANISIVISGIITLYVSRDVITDKRKETFKKSFLLINAYVLVILIIISIENVI